MHKEFHSTPELCWEQENGEVMTSSWTPDPMEVHQLEITNGSASGASTAEDWHKSHSQEDVYRRGMQLKAQNERNSRRSWAMAYNKKSPSASSTTSTNGRWAKKSTNQEDDEEEETERDDEEEEEEEEAAMPIAEQLTLLGNGEYRAVKTCRPVYAQGLSNTLPRRAGSPHCAAPPPSHPPPPPPPPSQMIRVDVTKSHGEYAAASAAVAVLPVPGGGERPTTPVMSSFRPSDNAKLYALPQGYSATLRPTKKPPLSSLTTPTPPRVSVTVNSTPLIPDPDYESQEEAEVEEQQSPGRSTSMPKSQSFCSDFLKAKSLLKTSISYPEELNEAPPHQQDDAYVTFVPVNGGERTPRRNSRQAVSLVHLPPPVENGNELHEQDLVSTISTMEVVVTSECSGQLWNACVWDPQTGSTLRTFKGGISASRSLHMIAGDYLISAQKDKPILHVILKLFFIFFY